jgi:5-methyltetrahydrofolate--homocysteine methyltransferase
MGTELAKDGLQGDCSANETHPGYVSFIHEAYIRAGSRAITTNTFLLNALTHSAEQQKVDLDRMNRLGMKNTREVAGNDHFVLGGIGPTGRLFDPDGSMTDSSCRAAYLAQAKSLAGAGADGLIIETMANLREALRALEACREATDRPVIVSMTFRTLKDGGRTMMGDRLNDCVQQLAAKGADAVGTNCGKLPLTEMAQIVARMRAVTNLPIVVQPNAGQPHGVETVYDMTPQEFAAGIGECRKAGATIFGGCCGAGPECIREAAVELGV